MGGVRSIYSAWGRFVINKEGEVQEMRPEYVTSGVLQHPPSMEVSMQDLSAALTEVGEVRADTRTWNRVCAENTNMMIMLTKQCISWDLYKELWQRRERGEVFYQSLAYLLWYVDELLPHPRETVNGVKVFDNRDETLLRMLAEDYLEGRVR
jgi:hypothetical protein